MSTKQTVNIACAHKSQLMFICTQHTTNAVSAQNTEFMLLVHTADS